MRFFIPTRKNHSPKEEITWLLKVLFDNFHGYIGKYILRTLPEATQRPWRHRSRSFGQHPAAHYQDKPR